MKLSPGDVRAIAAAVVDEIERRGLAIRSSAPLADVARQTVPEEPMHPDAVEMLERFREGQRRHRHGEAPAPRARKPRRS